METTIYNTFDLPVPYRGLNIYPIKVRDYFMFNSYVSSLTIDKNSMGDPDIIRMSELEYVFFTAENNINEQPYLLWFDRLLKLCLVEDESFEKIEKSIQRYKYDENNKPYFLINNQKYFSNDFVEIKNIICEQNMVDLPDENISKEVRDSLEEAKRIKNKNSSPGTLEDYVISLSTVTGWKPEYIYSMTVRKFIKSIRRYDNLIHYKIYLSASMSGMVEFKDKSFIKHWLNNLDEKDKYKDVSLGLDEIQSRLSFQEAKKEEAKKAKK